VYSDQKRDPTHKKKNKGGGRDKALGGRDDSFSRVWKGGKGGERNRNEKADTSSGGNVVENDMGTRPNKTLRA